MAPPGVVGHCATRKVSCPHVRLHDCTSRRRSRRRRRLQGAHLGLAAHDRPSAPARTRLRDRIAHFPELCFYAAHRVDPLRTSAPLTRLLAPLGPSARDAHRLDNLLASSMRPMPFRLSLVSAAGPPDGDWPSPRSVAMLRWLAALSHISTFIRAMIMGSLRRGTRSTARRRRPVRELAMKSALAGAITIDPPRVRVDVRIFGEARVPEVCQTACRERL